MPGKYVPRPEEIPTGLCECGCGGKTAIADRTFSKLRWFADHPKPFIKGHHAKHSHLNNRGPEHPAWKGGRYRSTYGYIYIYRPDHPAANCDGHMLEHRLVAEAMLGRYLEPTEHPHHINGIRDDNRPENLVVLTRSAHAQQHGPKAFAKDRKARGHHSETIICPVCGQTFTAAASNHRQYCSRVCFASTRRKQP